MRRTAVHFWPLFWVMFACNCVFPLLFFFKKIRTNLKTLFAISILVNVGMWLERFIIITGSLAHEYMPWEWSKGVYQPTWVEVAITVGSFAWFLLFFLLFAKMLPVVPMSEIKETLPVDSGAGKGAAA